MNWGLFGTLSVQLCTLLQVILQQIVYNTFSLDLYYLAFPNDRRLLKYLVYGIYVIEFVQTMIVAHDKFAVFGYGFGDIEALTRMNHSWLTVPVMSAVGARSVCYPLSVTYHEYSCGCRAGLLCIPNLHIIKIANHPDIHHLCSLLCSFSVAAQFIYLQISLTSSVAAVITGIYAFQAGNVIKLNNRKTSIAIGVCN